MCIRDRFDTEQTAVLNPTHENLGLNLPKNCVFAFLGAYIDEYASKSDTKQVSTFESAKMCIRDRITTILPEKGLVVSIQCPERGDFDQVKRALHEHFLMEL